MTKDDKAPPLRKGPWTQLSEQQVYDNPWITVTHQDVLTPSGSEGVYGVTHFKHHAVGVVPIDAEMNTWLVRQYRYPLEHDSWEIPEGGAAKDEDLLEAAQRELLEETGLSAASWRELLNLHLSNSVTDEKACIFVAEELSEGVAQPDENEELEVMKLPLADAIAMMDAGEITDAISVAALLAMARLYRL